MGIREGGKKNKGLEQQTWETRREEQQDPASRSVAAPGAEPARSHRGGLLPPAGASSLMAPLLVSHPSSELAEGAEG